MDLQEWELLPDDGFLEIHDDGGKKIFSRKYGGGPKSFFNTNYFEIGDPPVNPRSVANHLVPLPFQFPQVDDDEQVKQVTREVQIEHKVKKASPNLGAGAAETDQDTVSQVFFKKMKENEFVDMKMDSPKSSGRGIVPQIDTGKFQFEDTSEAKDSKTKTDKETVENKKTNLDSDQQEEAAAAAAWDEKNVGLNIWKWSLNGIGAICSFGVAAATICIIVIGTHQKNKQHHQRLRFQIYTDDKRIKEVVHHASKLNEAMSAMRGVPLTRAHITSGGYYDGL